MYYIPDGTKNVATMNVTSVEIAFYPCKLWKKFHVRTAKQK